MHLNPNVPCFSLSPLSLAKYPSHFLISHASLSISMFPPSLPLCLFIPLFLGDACLTVIICVLFFFSLDLSELAKAAKKKLQAVSGVELWDSNIVYLHYNPTNNGKSRPGQVRVSRLWMELIFLCPWNKCKMRSAWLKKERWGFYINIILTIM